MGNSTVLFIYILKYTLISLPIHKYIVNVGRDTYQHILMYNAKLPQK